MQGMPRTCGEASPPSRPAARHDRAGGGQRAWDAKNLRGGIPPPGRAGVGCLQPVAERPPTHCPAPSAPVPLALYAVPVPGEAL